ncbi:MAG: diguanylate cyclase domain-containing protein [Kineosporiaceae bacterium]
MRHAAWARRAGSFATRLVLAVLVTACLTAAAQSVLAGRLAARAMERDAVSRVVDVAAGAQARVGGRPSPGAPDVTADRTALEADVADLATQHGVVTARVVGAPPADQPTVVRTTAGSREVLVVTAPVGLRSGDVGLQVTLDTADARARSQALRRSLVVVVGLGAVAAVPLVLLLGGRRLLRRHGDVLRLAGTDDLTGTGSRRAFVEDLETALERATRVGEPLTLVLAELGGLQVVTATVGRRRAEALLGEAGTVLHERHSDNAYRIGGDVFALVLPGAGPDDAFAVADALRAEVADRAAPLSVTVGLAGLDERCTDFETLLIAADAALDEARSLGGNRVVGPGDSAFGLRWVANRPRD